MINDGSKDNSEKIVNEYLNKYPQHIKYYKKENGGLSSARNLGIEKCNTKYIGFVDSDDYIDKKMYQKLYENIIELESDISICNLIKCDINGNIQEYKSFEFKHIITKEEGLKYILNGKMPCYAWNKLYKTSLFKNNQIRYPLNRVYEDIPTTYKLIDNSKYISIVDEHLYYYVQHKGSICNSPTLKTAYDMLLNLEDIKLIHSTKNLNINSFIINTIVASKTAYYRAIFEDRIKNDIYSDIDKEKYNQILREYKKEIKPINFIKDKEITINNKIKFVMEYFNILKYIYFIFIKLAR